MNRHQEACELIWSYLKRERELAVSKGLEREYYMLFEPIENILTLTESRIQDDLEDQYQSTLNKEEDGPYAHI